MVKGRPRLDEQIDCFESCRCVLTVDFLLPSRLIRLPSFSLFKFITVYFYRSSFKAVVVVVIYRCGASSRAFFTDFNDLLERLATYLSPLNIVSDLSIHVDESLNSNAGELKDSLISHSSMLIHQHIDKITRWICSSREMISV